LGSKNSRKTTSRGDASTHIRIGIDTGGTFTDFIIAQGDRLFAFKLPSTPHNPAEAILKGVAVAIEGPQGVATIGAAIAGEQLEGGSQFTGLGAAPSEVVHGTTVATNALLERKGARTALVTTEGFQDVIEIGRQSRPRLYDLMVTRPAPLVAAELRFGVSERTLPDGSILIPLDQRQLMRLADEIGGRKAESVAVCLLFSFANADHERRIADALHGLNVPISLSHEIFPEYREYERTSTTVINAYLVPLMSRYLRALIEGLENKDAGRPNLKRKKEIRLRVMQSNGGSVRAEAAAAEPVRAILSGPAGGVVGALRLSAAAGINDIITFDMGGTSTDVALCRGEARTTNEAIVAGMPVSVPIIDIHTVGAGGGSIARVDVAGALRVGPESAGADPGPVCYGRGEEVTVTDANLVLGRFGGASLLGGDMPLDLKRAREFMSHLAAEMSRFSSRRVTTESAALGVISVANANMERALRVVSVERGQDPRLFTLVSFGGAGGLHVAELAAALRIPRILVPRSPGTLSALGVLLGDVVKDYSRTVMMKASVLDAAQIEREFKTLEAAGKRDLANEGFRTGRAKLFRWVAVRYIGQSFEIDIPWDRGFQTRFHSAHSERYGYSDTARPIEIVSVRVRAIGITEKPPISRSIVRRRALPKPAFVAGVYFASRKVPTRVYLRETLKPGATLSGPAIVTEYSSTLLIPAGRKAEVDPWHNIVII
jgi:N-methylhydantoinase A